MKRMIRVATQHDAVPCQAIYAPIVRQTHTSFELEPPDAEEMRKRILGTLPEFPWLVCCDEDRVIGYAYASRHRERPAYRWSVDVSVYVDPTAHRQGVGRALYESLFEVLRIQGFVSAFAGIALPNEASVGLHESMGFALIGIYRNAGFKLAKWHDVGWWQLGLREAVDEPSIPSPFAQLSSPIGTVWGGDENLEGM